MADTENNKNSNSPAERAQGNAPALRFPGFTEPWKRMTVSDLLEFYSTNSLSWEQLSKDTESEFMNLHYGLIHVGLPTIVNIEENKLPYIKENAIPRNYVLCENGDVSFADASEDTSEVAKAIEFTGIGNEKVISGLHTIHGRDKQKKTIVGFKGYLFSSEAFHKQTRRIAQGSKVFSISPRNFSEIFVSIPSKEEQRKIAELLLLLDERIATQRRLIEDLEKLKSAIIDKLLGHLRTYESDRMVKLKEIGNFIRGLTYSADDIVKDGGIVVVRANNLSNGEAVNLYNEIVRVDKPILDSQRLKDGDIVICMANGSSALVGKASYYNKTTDSIATIGAFCGIYRSDKKIVRWLLQTTKYKHAVQKSLQGGNGAIANLSPNDILGLPFVIPKRETLIVELLQEFDEKLDIEMSLLHNLQKEKQYLLFQMFI